MTPEQIQQFQHVIGQALRDPLNFPWLCYIVALILLGLASYLGAFLGERAKNRALRKDIETLTHKEQGVITLYTQQVEMFKANLQLRNAALAERLKVHQEAYSLWVRMFDRVWETDSEATYALYQECRKWWVDNCLYLSPNAREQFMLAMNCIMMHRQLRNSESHDLLKENWKKIENLGAALVKGAELDEFGEAKLLALPIDETSAQRD